MTSLVHRCTDKPARLSVPAPARPSQPTAVHDYFAQDAADRCAKLFPRQREVLVLIGKGLDHHEIGAAMGISFHTVCEHRTSIYRALGVNGAVEAAVLATKAGWL
jgi:DNA-binding NarL/FixJ family response regulator